MSKSHESTWNQYGGPCGKKIALHGQCCNPHPEPTPNLRDGQILPIGSSTKNRKLTNRSRCLTNITQLVRRLTPQHKLQSIEKISTDGLAGNSDSTPQKQRHQRIHPPVQLSSYHDARIHLTALRPDCPKAYQH